MRWYVEVTQLEGKELLERLCLESGHWQPALQRARKSRGEGESLQGLTVEFLDDGCRAVDAVRKLQYEVSRAADDAELCESSSVSTAAPVEVALVPAPVPAPAPAPLVTPPADKGLGRVAAPDPEAPPVSVPRPLAQRPLAPRPFVSATTLGLGNEPSAPKSSRSPLVTATPAAPASSRSPLVTATPAAPASSRSPLVTATPAAPASSRSPLVAASSAAVAKPEVTPVAVLLSTRRRDPDDRVPLTHVERAYGSNTGLDLVSAATLARARLDELRRELAGTKPGIVVDIAVFDHVYETKPEKPPLVTLRWCDWHSEPVLTEKPYADTAYPNKANADKDYPNTGTATSSPSGSAGSDRSPESAEPIRPSRILAVGSESSVIVPSGAARAEVRRPVERAPSVARADAAKADAAKADAAKADAAKADAATADAAKADAAKADAAKADAATADAATADSAPIAAASSRRNIGARTAEVLASPIGQAHDAVSVSDLPATPPPANPRAGGGVARLHSKTIVAGSAVRRPRAIEASASQQFAGVRQRAAQGPEIPSTAPTRAERDAQLQYARERVSVLPPLPSRPGTRVDGDELLTDLFESMSELNYLETALDGAAFVLTLALEKLPCQLGLVSLFDLDRRQFVVVRQQGGAKSALLLRLADGARLVHAAMKKREPVLASGANVADELDGRWKEIGLTPTTLLCAPVERAGRTLGLIELANPLDGKTFTEGDRHALGYIGQQFAEFLSERSVLVDPDLVLAAAEFDLR